MQELQLFNFNGSNIRTLLIEDEPYFVGKDVAEVLGYSKPTDALAKHVDEDDSLKWGITDNLGRSQQTKIINESGMYSLVLSSKLPQAKEFKRWVTSEVLPTIRKHGAYATETKLEEMLNDPQTMITTLQRLKEEQDARKALQIEVDKQTEGRLIAEQQVAELKPKADYTDKILRNKSLLPIGKIAKDYGMSAIEMNRLLHKLHVQYKQGDAWLLYSEHQRKGWTQSETFEVTNKTTGEKNVKYQTKWTQKGRLGLYELLKKNGIVPMIEQEALE